MAKGQPRPREIDDADEDLGEEQGVCPGQDWEDKGLEVVTAVVDHSLGTLAEMVRGTPADINITPAYQRRVRWDGGRKSRLIESFLMNVPVPPIFLNEDELGRYSVIDGKQRLLAISEFMANELRLQGLKCFRSLEGMTYSDLPPQMKSTLRSKPALRTIFVLRQSAPALKTEVFVRLNTGGVTLNAQELRNSVYAGSLNDLIYELSESPDFHSMLGMAPGPDQRSQMYMQMKDAELVLRFLTFSSDLDACESGIRYAMDNYMEAHKNAGADLLAQARERFITALAAVDACFGAHAFARWDPENSRWRSLMKSV